MSAPRDDLRSGPRRWLLIAYVLAWPFAIVASAYAWSRHWAWGLAATAFVARSSSMRYIRRGCFSTPVPWAWVKGMELIHT